MEVLDAMFAKARYLSKIGSWESAYVAYDLILAKEKTSTGKKIDANMEKAKIALITQVQQMLAFEFIFYQELFFDQHVLLLCCRTSRGPKTPSSKPRSWWRPAETGIGGTA